MKGSSGARRLRVLHVMEATIGGTRRHLVDVARWQARAGVDVSVAASAERTAAFRADLAELARERVAVREVPMVREIDPAADARDLGTLERLMVELRPDVVHTHSSKAGALGRVASIATGIGVRVHTPHTFAFLFHAMFSAHKRALFRAVERVLGAATTATVAVSDTEGATIRASGVVDPARVRVVPNGIDPGRWVEARALARSTLGVPPGARVVTVAGLLNVAKGQDLAIRALDELGRDDVFLLLAGEGDDEPALRELARELWLEGRVRFLGWRDDLPGLLAASDVVLLPSRWEGMPYVVLEAMAVGRAVVATRVDGARELVVDGETGFLCESASPASIAVALERALAAPASELARLGAAGRARVLERFTAERMARGLIDVYREVA